MTAPEAGDPLPLTATVSASKAPLSCVLDGETVLVNIQTGVYYGIDPVGTFIWNQMGEPKTVAAIRDAVLAKYKVEPGECERDLQSLLRDLIAAGLVEVAGSPAEMPDEKDKQVSSSSPN